MTVDGAVAEASPVVSAATATATSKAPSSRNDRLASVEASGKKCTPTPKQHSEAGAYGQRGNQPWRRGRLTPAEPHEREKPLHRHGDPAVTPGREEARLLVHHVIFTPIPATACFGMYGDIRPGQHAD